MAIPNLMSLVVADMAASLRFYCLLGMEIPAVSDSDGHVEVTLPGGFRIAWDTVDLMRSIYPDWDPAPSGHRMGFAFLCASPAEVDALYGRVTAAGYASHKAPWDAFWGQRYAVVVDPDGNLIDLFAALEQTA
jgi:catechol 2,3-dioxygenase-like lactoylglutathione lyase family enzyme